MDFQDNILDILVEKNAIDQSDSEEVMAFPRRKERVRCLLLKLAHYDETTFKQFIEALQQENRGDLARSLTQKYEEYKDTRTNNSSKCNHCKIKLRVDIKDIIDTLYHERVIDEAFVDKVNRSTPSARSMLWNECFFRLKRSNKHDILSQCLHAKYRRYVTEPTGHYFKCTCFTTLLSGVQDSDDTSSASGSLADRSASTSASSSPFSTFSSSSSTMRRQLDINVSSSSRGFKMSKYLYKKSGLNSRRHVRTLFDKTYLRKTTLRLVNTRDFTAPLLPRKHLPCHLQNQNQNRRKISIPLVNTKDITAPLLPREHLNCHQNQNQLSYLTLSSNTI